MYVSKKKNGKYKCVVCTNEVFSTEQQFQSGRGYAAFKTALKNAIELDPKVVNGKESVLLNKKCPILKHPL